MAQHKSPPPGRSGRARRYILSLGLVVALVATLSSCDLLAPIRTDSARPGWTLVSADEFNGTRLDQNAWKAYHSTYGDGNKELACLTPDNVAVSGGILKISAKKEQKTCPSGSTRSFTSGFLGTREVGRYFPRFARFEVRAKLPHAQGLWPAFWLRHRNGASTAEVDIMEYFHSQVPGRTTATLHLDQRYNISKKTAGFEAPTTTPGWHTWAVEITPHADDVKFTFFIDDAPILSYVDTQHYWTSADPDATWDMALNVAVGGTWVGHPDGTLGYLDILNRCAQGGTAPNGCRADGVERVDYNRSAMEVDYVRVYVPS